MRARQSSLWVARWGFSAPLVAVLTLIVILGLPGCSDEPLDINTSQEDVNFFDLPFDEELLSKRGTVIKQVYVISQYVEADEGGTIEIRGNDGDFAFIVEPFSMPEDALITIKIYEVQDEDARVSFIYEFAPDGLVFSEPATLVLDADIVADGGDSITLYYLDGKRWVPMDNLKAVNGTFLAKIPHFSRWGSGGR